jgi:hypothetical protein
MLLEFIVVFRVLLAVVVNCYKSMLPLYRFSGEGESGVIVRAVNAIFVIGYMIIPFDCK